MSFKSENQVCFFFDRLDCLSEVNLRRDGRLTALILVQSGAVIVSNGLASSELGSKECGLVISDVPLMTFRQTSTTYAIGCLIPPKSASLNPAQDGAVLVSKAPASVQLRTLFQLGLELKDDSSALNLRLRDAIGEAVLAAYAAGANGQTQLGLPAPVRRVCAYIDANYNEFCDLDRLSEIAGVSRGHLGSEFRKHLGKSPVRYLWELRTRKAVEIISSTDLALIEIAERCGYKSHFHLSREVKSLTGFSPKELRENASLGESFSKTRRQGPAARSRGSVPTDRWR